ncbi:MAG: HEAT repeat domain-containing protein [Armatimonadota bacterium]
MKLNNRTIRVLAIIAVILIAVVTLTRVSQARHTARYLQDLTLQEPDKVMEAMTQLRQRGASVGPRLAALVQAGDAQAAPRAAWLLGLVQSHAGDQALVAALASPDTGLRVAALQSLGQLRVITAEAEIGKVLLDVAQKPEVRASAAYALGMIATTPAVEALVKVMAERPAPVIAAEAGAAPGPAAPAPAPDTALTVRLAAATALAHTKAAASADVLAQALRPSVEPSPEVRVAAAYALGDIGSMLTDEEQIRVALTGLLDGLKDAVGDVRIASGHSLGRVDLPAGAAGVALANEVKTALEQAREDKHYWARLAATEALAH